MDLVPFSLILLVDSGITPVNGAIAALALLSNLGIFGLIYHVGRYIGRNDAKWDQTERRLSSLDNQDVLHAKLETIVASLQATVIETRTEMREEIQLLRKRAHMINNVLQRLLLGDKRAIEFLTRADEEEEEGGGKGC